MVPYVLTRKGIYDKGIYDILAGKKQVIEKWACYNHLLYTYRKKMAGHLICKRGTHTHRSEKDVPKCDMIKFGLMNK